MRTALLEHPALPSEVLLDLLAGHPGATPVYGAWPQAAPSPALLPLTLRPGARPTPPQRRGDVLAALLRRADVPVDRLDALPGPLTPEWDDAVSSLGLSLAHVIRARRALVLEMIDAQSPPGAVGAVVREHLPGLLEGATPAEVAQLLHGSDRETRIAIAGALGTPPASARRSGAGGVSAATEVPGTDASASPSASPSASLPAAGPAPSSGPSSASPRTPAPGRR